jgi:response regulator RpfG family c-di-GMP phosphodiesterase
MELKNPHIIDLLDEAKEKKTSIVSGDILVGYYRSLGEIDNFVIFKGIRAIDAIDREMIDLFSANISVAFDNVYLNERIINTQKDVIYKLGEVVESRSEETSDHVRKVSEYVFLLASKYGIDYETAELLKVSASMHDIGKIGIAQNVLLKRDKLSELEIEEVKKHSDIGYSILKASNLKLMQVAAIQAYEHHENYDGSGYPRGLSGQDIHIYGRILAIADVFDTMTRETVYRGKMSLDDAFAFIEDNKGKKFDPELVDIFLKHKKEILEIFNKTDFEEKV